MIANIFVVVAGLIILLIGSGIVYEFFASRSAKNKYKTPIGKLVDVGGYQLHMIKMGERQPNQPVIVLETSVGANSLDWQKVQPLVAEFAQVVSYDRAGNGWSDKTDTVRTPENIVADLHTMLVNADIAPPYVLVGHRYGGMFIRKFQEQYPDDVVGLVLVDSSHPDVFNEEDNEAEIKRLQRNVRYFQPLGLVRLVTRRNYRVSGLGKAQKEQYIAMMMADNANLLREAIPIIKDGINLPEKIDVPLMVVSRVEDEDLARERRWAEYQRDLTSLSETSKHIHTDTSSSWIPFKEPKIIANAIQEMLQSLS